MLLIRIIELLSIFKKTLIKIFKKYIKYFKTDSFNNISELFHLQYDFEAFKTKRLQIKLYFKKHF